MLRLIQTELMKLRRRTWIAFMLLAALLMPFLALMYFSYFGEKGIQPVLFYKWSAFGWTLFIILPFILGILGIVLMHDENKYDMQKQLWIVPVHKMSYFFSKFWVVLIFSAAFMLLTAVASVLFSVLSGYVAFEWKSIVFLLEKCMEIAVLTSLAILPVLAAAVRHKDYVFPVCMTLLYVFSGFFMASVNPYAHPLSCVSVILNRNGDIPGVLLNQPVCAPLALVSMGIWDGAAFLLAAVSLKQRK